MQSNPSCLPLLRLLVLLVLLLPSQSLARSEYHREFLMEQQSTKPDSHWNQLQPHCGRNQYNRYFTRFLAQSHLRKRIIGGSISANGQWPWLVSMRYQLVFGGKFQHLCGGTLIHPKWILTAAHCFEKQREYPTVSTDASRWLMRIGEHELMADGGDQVDAEVKRVIIHPQRVNNHNDVALVELKRPVRINRNRNVACLPHVDEEFSVGSRCITAGWGHVKVNASELSSVLRHVAVPIVSNQYCSKAYKPSPSSLLNKIPFEGDNNPPSQSFLKQMLSAMYNERSGIRASNICAGDELGGKDSCQFDSGGPLMCPVHQSSRGDDESQWVVAGVISRGDGCGTRGKPGIYARVSTFMSWISVVIDMEEEEKEE